MIVHPFEDSLGPFPVAKVTGLLLVDRLPITVENGIPWDVSALTEAKAVAAPESQVRLIFQVKGDAGDEVFGNNLSTVHLDLCEDTGSSVSWQRFCFGRVKEFFLVAVIASFVFFGLVVEVAKLLGSGGDWW